MRRCSPKTRRRSAYVLPTRVANLSLMPADRNLTGAEIEMVTLPEREHRLKRVLEPLRAEFDHVFIDCPPSLGLLTLNALVAADAVLIPLHCEYFALEGLADLVGTMRRVRSALNPSLDIEGVLLDDVRRPHEPRSVGGARRARILQRESLQHDHSAERASRRGAEPRDSRRAVRLEIARRGRVRRPCQRTARASRGLEENHHARTTPRARQRPQRADSRCCRSPLDRDPSKSTSICWRPTSSSRASIWTTASSKSLPPSIKANGIIQPILVRRTGNTYRIIAGERRWRAAQRAGLQRVPVVVRDVADGDKQLLELALIENLQREGLNPIDEALAYQRLADEFSLTQEQIAAAVGKDRSSVANFMRLLKLPEEVRADLASGALSTGHARALLALPDAAAQRHGAREAISRRLSVRETEALVKKLSSPKPRTASASGAPAPTSDVHTRAAEDRMRFALGTKVRINRRGSGGRIEIEFGSEDELNRIFEVITSRG